MKINSNYLDQINNHINHMEKASEMGLNEKSYSKTLKANYVYSVISDMFVATAATIVIGCIAVLIR